MTGLPPGSLFNIRSIFLEQVARRAACVARDDRPVQIITWPTPSVHREVVQELWLNLKLVLARCTTPIAAAVCKQQGPAQETHRRREIMELYTAEERREPEKKNEWHMQ
jgi:hypothetical protein